MLKSGTWPGDVVVEPLSNMDSAGSCDSVISINSGSSDDSMEHLSPEERACLVFLEETLEALEVQEDSGFSNDEPDSSPKAEKEKEMRVHEISSLSRSQGPLTHVSADPAPTLTTQSKTHHITLNQNSEPQSAPALVASMKDTETEEAQTSPFPDSAAGCVNSSAVNPTEVLGLTLNGGLSPEKATSTWPYPGESSESDPSIIPPPSDFMDELDSVLQPEVKDIPLPAEFFTKPAIDVEVEQLQSTESVKTTSLSSSVTEDPPSSPPPVSPSVLQMSPTSEFSPSKSAPVVAPKPKKLFSSILLKSQKTAAAGSDGSLSQSVPTSSDRTLMDPQKVRFEALRKLGLLKSHEEPTGHPKSSKPFSKTRQSWTGPSPLKSPTTSLSPPMTPSYNHISSPSPASVHLQPPPAVLPPASPTQDPDILPAPAAFSDALESLSSVNQLPAFKEVVGGGTSVPLTLPLTSSALVKEITSPKVMDVKSVSESSGLSLISYTTSQNATGADQGVGGEQSLKQLCSSQPQPTSTGNGKEFSHAKGVDLQAGHASSKQPNSHRPPYALSAFQHSRESAKLPRSQGISVLICPRAENEEDRRKALKKLGLLRD